MRRQEARLRGCEQSLSNRANAKDNHSSPC
jgi:hypothetical protein